MTFRECMPTVVQPQSPHETPVNLQLSWKKTESPTSKVFLPLIPLCSQNIDLGLDSVQMLLRIKGPFNIYEDKKRGLGSAKLLGCPPSTDPLLTTTLVKDEQHLGRHFSEQINLKLVTNFWMYGLHYCDNEENQWESLIMFVNKVLSFDSEENQWKSLIMFVNKVLTFDLFFLLKQSSAMYVFPFFSSLNQSQNSSTIASPSGQRSSKFGTDQDFSDQSWLGSRNLL